jgi:hypothetical protein
LSLSFRSGSFLGWRLRLGRGRCIVPVARGLVLGRRRGRHGLEVLGAGMRIKQIATRVEDLLAVSAACEPTGPREQRFGHAENRFAVGTAGG